MTSNDGVVAQSADRRGPGTTRRRLDRGWNGLPGYLFIAPALVGYAAFVVGPVLVVIWYSLQQLDFVSGSYQFVGLGNYSELLAGSSTIKVLQNTGVFVAGTVPLQMLMGLAMAVLVNQTFKGSRLFRTVFFLPVLTTLAAWTIVWNFLLQANGGVNAILQVFGVEGANYLREPGWAMFWLILVYVFKAVGVTMILFLAALQSVPQQLIEAATTDGASSWAAFRHVTLPLIAPFTLMISIIATISALKTFELVLLLTDGGPADATSTLVHRIYVVVFRFFERGPGSALAVILFVLALGLTIAQFSARSKWVHGER